MSPFPRLCLMAISQIDAALIQTDERAPVGRLVWPIGGSQEDARPGSANSVTTRNVVAHVVWSMACAARVSVRRYALLRCCRR